MRSLRSNVSNFSVLTVILAATAQTGLIVSPAAGQEVARRQVGQFVLEDVPEWDDSLRARMLQYLQVRNTSLRDINEDGSAIIVGTRFGNTTQLHHVAAPMGARRQITFFDEPTAGGAFLPGSGGKQLFYRKDIGGNEKNQIYLFDLESGRHEMLTGGDSRNAGPAISKNGRYIAYSGTARNQRDYDVYVVDLKGERKPRMLWEVKGNYYVSEFSPDETKLLVLKFVSARETHWFVVDVESGRHVRITPEEPPTYYSGGVWNNDGSAVFLTSDRGGEFRKLYRFDLQYAKWTNLSDDINWDISSVAVDPAGKGIAFVANEDGMSALFFADEWGHGRKKITALPSGIVRGLAFAANGGVLGFTLSTPVAPSDAYTCTFPDGRLTRWTASEVGGLNTETFVAPQLIRYPTFDSIDGKPRTIPAFYYRAPGPGPHPLVIHVHGGPEGQERARLRGTFQYWLNELGISIISPNVRGSTGYGRSFHQLDNAVKREDSVRDVGALLDWVEKQPELDAKRVGIFGGSYGGYMVLSSLANYPDRFKAGIDIVGIASFVTFLEQTPEFRRDLRRAEYGDERVPEIREVLQRISPLNNAEKITASLFVLHGKNDPRVPVNEAEQIVAKRRGLGRETWYAVALNEGHGFRKRVNSDLATIMYAIFWEQRLLK